LKALKPAAPLVDVPVPGTKLPPKPAEAPKAGQ
jgi:hypothetical protein